jgi:DNA-binding GntR family transcriptional regulator
MPNKKSESLTDLAYNYIKKNILSLTYLPGSVLTESELAKELGISRMPVRSAVTALENEGLLVSEHYKSIMVKDITRKDVFEIYQLRELLETNALKMIFKLKKNHEYSYRIEEKVVRMKAAQNDFYKWEEADAEFHAEIVNIYDNERINRIYKNNQTELIRIGVLSKKNKNHIENINNRLNKFVKSIRDECFEDALEILITDHIHLGKDMALKHITK